MRFLPVLLVILGACGDGGGPDPVEAKRKTKADVASTRERLMNVQMALERYGLDHGSYPTVEQGLKFLLDAAGDEDLNDAWGRPLIYRLNEDGSYVLGSSGPDGKEGTEDDIILH